MKKEIIYRLIEEVIKESEDYNLEDLLKILRPLEAKDEFAYEMFASLVEDALSEEALRLELGVTKVIEDEFGVKIYFNSDEKMQSFVEILKSIGLSEWYPATAEIEYHFAAKKQRQSTNPKMYAKMGPRVVFDADNYRDNEE